MSKSLLLHFSITSTLALAALGCLSWAAATPPVAAPPPPRPAARAPRALPDPKPHATRPSLVVELPEIRIVAHSTRRRPPEAEAVVGITPNAPEGANTLVPCSGWEELGPVSSTRAGVAPLTRHVQRLCPRR